MEEILIGDEVKIKLQKGINKLSNAVLKTYGPYGGTVLIADEYDRPYVTKDGVSVSNYITLKDPIENMAIILLKEVAQKTVEQAGDGTTTSICLAQSLINKGYKLLEQGYDYNVIKKNLVELEDLTITKLKEIAVKLNKNNIIDVATISSNNDSEVANLIKDAYMHSDVVKVQHSDLSEDKLITVNGMKLNGSYFNKAFINNDKKQSIEYDKVTFIIIEGKLDKMNVVSDFIQKNPDKNIIIMADHFSDEIVSVFKSNYNRGALKIGLVKTPGFAQHRKDLVKDIITYTKAYHSLNGYYIAELDSLTATKDSLVISKETGVDNSKDLMFKLKDAIELSDVDDYSKDLLNQRLENLKGSVSIIKVGAKSESEMKEKKDRFDDAVLAVSCAIEEGIITGGGVTLNDIYKDSNSENIFIACLASPYKTIQKSYKEGELIINKDNVIDPVKVTRCALQNAISVAKIILSTDTVVLNERLWK